MLRKVSDRVGLRSLRPTWRKRRPRAGCRVGSGSRGSSTCQCFGPSNGASWDCRLPLRLASISADRAEAVAPLVPNQAYRRRGAARSQSWRRLVPTMSSPAVLAQAARETEFRRQRLSGRLRPRLRQNRRNLVRRPPRAPLSLGRVATFASEENRVGLCGLPGGGRSPAKLVSDSPLFQ